MLLATKLIVCDISFAPVLLLFGFDIFKYSAEATCIANFYIILSIVIFYSLLLGAGVETAVCFFFRTSANAWAPGECYCCEGLEGCGDPPWWSLPSWLNTVKSFFKILGFKVQRANHRVF